MKLKLTIRFYVALSLLVFAACVSSDSKSEPRSHFKLARFEFSQVHMGTEFKVILYARDAASAAQAANAGFERIAALDTIMSDYHASSELMRLCARAGGEPVRVSDDLFRVLSRAQDLATRSKGAFDVSVGPVVRLWRGARARRELPEGARLAEALKLVGYQNLKLDPQAKTAQLLKRGMLLDLGGIAKGYAGDEAIATLKHLGIAHALVAGAGDIVVSASPPGTAGWVIGVAPLDAPQKTPQRFFLLHNGAVSTSGDSEQHLEIAGVRYSHIINPKTGRALTGRASITVVAPDGVTADSLATAVGVLGPEQGLKLVESYARAGVLYSLETAKGERSYELRFPENRKQNNLRGAPNVYKPTTDNNRLNNYD